MNWLFNAQWGTLKIQPREQAALAKKQIKYNTDVCICISIVFGRGGLT